MIEWARRYNSEDGIILFVREVLGGTPDAKQEQILRAVARRVRRISVRSGHGVGKTTVLAWAAIWHICVKFPQKTVCTAPTKGQLYDALASEIKSWMTKLPSSLIDKYSGLFEVKVERIELRAAPNESFIAFNTSRAETPEAMAGVHSENVLLIADEASGIPEPVFESSIGSMSGHNAVTVLAGNPVRSTGLFYDSFHKLKDLWFTVHISCVGHARVALDFIEDVVRRYGRDSNAYRVRVEGEFPLGDDDTIIARESAASALFRDVQPISRQPVWGLDCARFGNDASALCRRRGNSLDRKVDVKQGWDTMRLAGWVKSEFDATLPADRPSDINVDVIGIGAGVTDRLIELGLPARGINVGEKSAIFSDQYADLRTELWFKGKTWLDNADCSIAGDEDLVEELVTTRYTFKSSGQKKAESKDDMKKRGLKSPNRADAFLLTLATDALTAQHGSKLPSGHTVRWNQPLVRDVGAV